MIAPLLWSILACPCAVPAPGPLAALEAAQDAELEAKIAAAGRDTAKLLALADACAGAGQTENARKVYRKVLELDAGNEAAHKALQHHYYDKQWFESFAELAKYKREEDARMKSKGLARWKDTFVPEADVPFLNMGWSKDDKGAWAHPAELARAKQVAEWQAAGYQFRADDDSWIAPGDIAHWTALEWKCGDQWLDMAKADEYHAQLGQWWKLAGEHFTVWTTCDWNGGNAARWYADRVYPELVRIFGLEPRGKPHFVVLNSLAQYNQVSGGTPPLLPESEGVSSLHGAYFADLCFDLNESPPRYLGAGVSFWDRRDEKLRGWGPYWLRWAAAQSFVEAIDPSWSAVGERLAGAAAGAAQPSPVAFWSEKRIPRWLRYGAASYVERFMRDPEAAAGADPWSLRNFAFGELKKAGGLHKLEELFAFKLDVSKPEESGRLYHEAGLLTAFLLDGAEGDKKLAERHKAFTAALKSGSRKEVSEAAEALQKELARNEPSIRKFAGL